MQKTTCQPCSRYYNHFRALPQSHRQIFLPIWKIKYPLDTTIENNPKNIPWLKKLYETFEDPTKIYKTETLTKRFIITKQRNFYKNQRQHTKLCKQILKMPVWSRAKSECRLVSKTNFKISITQAALGKKTFKYFSKVFTIYTFLLNRLIY